MKNLAPVFKALGDETRLSIVNMLVGKELCVCDIMDAFKLSQPAISHHLKILRQASIIEDTKEGKWVFYRLNNETLAAVTRYLTDIKQQDVVRQRCNPISPNKLPQEEE